MFLAKGDPAPTATPKTLCKDCSLLGEAVNNSGATVPGSWVCKHEMFVDLVTGRPINAPADHVRSSRGACGPNAKMFVAKSA